MKVVSAGLTDVGRKRNHNEDSFLIDEELQLYVVADGMGGHAGGGTASRIAVETIDKELRRARDGRTTRSSASPALQDSPLPEVIRTRGGEGLPGHLHRRPGRPPPRRAWAPPSSRCWCSDEHAFFAHVGDSRAYLVRGDLIQQISEDHSLVNEQIKAGMITPEEAKHSRYKNIITRSVGFEEEVQVDVMGLVSEPGDTFILCSDGLANMVEDKELLEMSSRQEPLGRVPKRLIDLANERGGDDNITVIVVQVSGLSSAADAELPGLGFGSLHLDTSEVGDNCPTFRR